MMGSNRLFIFFKYSPKSAINGLMYIEQDMSFLREWWTMERIATNECRSHRWIDEQLEWTTYIQHPTAGLCCQQPSSCSSLAHFPAPHFQVEIHKTHNGTRWCLRSAHRHLPSPHGCIWTGIRPQNLTLHPIPAESDHNPRLNWQCILRRVRVGMAREGGRGTLRIPGGRWGPLRGHLRLRDCVVEAWGWYYGVGEVNGGKVRRCASYIPEALLLNKQQEMDFLFSCLGLEMYVIKYYYIGSKAGLISWTIDWNNNRNEIHHSLQSVDG